MDSTSSNGFSKSAILGVVGGALLAIGSFLSWASVTVNFDKLAAILGIDPAQIPASVRANSSTSVTGWKAGDGKWTLVAGILVVVGVALHVAMAQKGRVWAALILVGGVAGGGVALYDAIDLKTKTVSTAEQAFANAGLPGKLSDYFSIKIGIGLWMCIVGGIVAIVGGVMSLGRRDVSAPAAGIPSGFTAPPDSGFGAPSVPTPTSSMPTPTPSMPIPAPSSMPMPVETEAAPPETGPGTGGAGTPPSEDTGGDGSTTS